MTQSDHVRAREMIALGGMGDSAAGQQAWLEKHLADCSPCREYASAAGRAVRAMHADPFTADFELVQTTQMRVRMRTAELRQRRERAWMVGWSCLLVGVLSAITTPFVWRGFAWLGTWAGISSPLWQTGFTFFWIAPALVVGVALLARGSHLNSARQVEWK